MARDRILVAGFKTDAAAWLHAKRRLIAPAQLVVNERGAVEFDHDGASTGPKSCAIH